MFYGTLRSLNHYQTLGIGFRSTKAEIKSAYHILAKKFHPDQNEGSPEAEQKFRKVKEAYEALSDRVRRAEYDKDYIASRRMSFQAAPGSETVDSDDSLTRNQFIILYIGVFGLPFLVSWLRPVPQLALPAVAVSSTKTPVVGPEISARDEVVQAFFNPFTSRWQRLDDYTEPPTPLELHQFMAKHHKGTYQQAVRSGAVSLSDTDPFPVHEVPSRVTVGGFF